ncbi:MAG: hypothetical protein QM757_09450 [Paludibaculum sp.]
MQGSMNAAMVAGATLPPTARWDKDLLPDLFETYGVSFWNAAPTMIVDVLASARCEVGETQGADRWWRCNADRRGRTAEEPLWPRFR